jgi:hypothetical protein
LVDYPENGLVTGGDMEPVPLAVNIDTGLIDVQNLGAGVFVGGQRI